MITHIKKTSSITKTPKKQKLALKNFFICGRNAISESENFDLNDKINEASYYIDGLANNIYSLAGEKFEKQMLSSRIKTIKKKTQKIEKRKNLVEIFNENAKRKKLFGPYLRNHYSVDNQVKTIKTDLALDEEEKINFIKRKKSQEQAFSLLDLNHLQYKILGIHSKIVNWKEANFSGEEVENSIEELYLLNLPTISHEKAKSNYPLKIPKSKQSFNKSDFYKTYNNNNFLRINNSTHNNYNTQSIFRFYNQSTLFETPRGLLQEKKFTNKNTNNNSNSNNFLDTFANNRKINPSTNKNLTELNLSKTHNNNNLKNINFNPLTIEECSKIHSETSPKFFSFRQSVNINNNNINNNANDNNNNSNATKTGNLIRNNFSKNLKYSENNNNNNNNQPLIMNRKKISKKSVLNSTKENTTQEENLNGNFNSSYSSEDLADDNLKDKHKLRLKAENVEKNKIKIISPKVSNHRLIHEKCKNDYNSISNYENYKKDNLNRSPKNTQLNDKKNKVTKLNSCLTLQYDDINEKIFNNVNNNINNINNVRSGNNISKLVRSTDLKFKKFKLNNKLKLNFSGSENEKLDFEINNNLKSNNPNSLKYYNLKQSDTNKNNKEITLNFNKIKNRTNSNLMNLIGILSTKNVVQAINSSSLCTSNISKTCRKMTGVKKKEIEGKILKACLTTSHKSIGLKYRIENFQPIKNKVFKLRKQIGKKHLMSQLEKDIVKENERYKTSKRFFIYPKDLMNPVYICDDEKNVMRESNYVDNLNEEEAYKVRNLLYNKYKVSVGEDDIYGYNPDVKKDFNYKDFKKNYKQQQRENNSFKLTKLMVNTLKKKNELKENFQSKIKINSKKNIFHPLANTNGKKGNII